MGASPGSKKDRGGKVEGAIRFGNWKPGARRRRRKEMDDEDQQKQTWKTEGERSSGDGHWPGGYSLVTADRHMKVQADDEGEETRGNDARSGRCAITTGFVLTGGKIVFIHTAHIEARVHIAKSDM